MEAFCSLIVTILFSLCLSQPPDFQNGTGVFLDNPDAICIDGTRGLYYINKEGVESTKYVIFLQGGGVCVGLSQTVEPSCFDTCYDRSSTPMGSTKADRPWVDMNNMPPQLSNNKTISPLMADWNHIFIRYCDGGFYSGYKSKPDSYNNTNIYYRGSVILYEVILDLLNNHDLDKATDIVIAGCSAGAQAVYININIIYEWIKLGNKNKINMYTIADSGFIVDYNGITNNTQMDSGQKVAYYEHNMSGNVPPQCVDDMNNKNNMDPYHCVFPQYNALYINQDINFFALQSQFDAFQIQCVLGSNEPPLIETFGMNLEHLVNDSLLLNKENHGAMIDSCHHHCGGWNEINLNGVTQCDAFTDFYNNKQKQRIWYQNQTFPCDACCGD